MSTRLRATLVTAFTWVLVLAFFFPVFWMLLNGFKPESVASSINPKLFFTPVLDGFSTAFDRGMQGYLINSADRLGDRDDHLGGPGRARRVRPVDPAGEERRAVPVVLHLHPLHAVGRGRAAAVHDPQDPRAAGQHLHAGHRLRRGEPAGHGVDDALVLPRGPLRDRRSRPRRRRRPLPRDRAGRAAPGPARGRRRRAHHASSSAGTSTSSPPCSPAPRPAPHPRSSAPSSTGAASSSPCSPPPPPSPPCPSSSPAGSPRSSSSAACPWEPSSESEPRSAASPTPSSS